MIVSQLIKPCVERSIPVMIAHNMIAIHHCRDAFAQSLWIIVSLDHIARIHPGWDKHFVPQLHC